jgi:hypothetical protein
MRDLAGNLNANVDRLVPTREDIQKQQEMAQQQQIMMMQQQQIAAEQAAMLQADGSQQGGRESNYMSSRPNGR